MKRALLFLLLLTLLNSARADFCSHDEWDVVDKTLGITASLAQAADWRQTQVIAKNPQRWREMNPALGEHPSMRRVNEHFLVSSAVVAGIAHCLPSSWRKGYLGAVTGFELAFARHNYGIGIRFGF